MFAVKHWHSSNKPEISTRLRCLHNLGSTAAFALYCFLNLAKALILRRGIHASLPQPVHGLKERLRGPLNRELEDAYLKAEMSHGTHLQVFHELLRAIRGTGLPVDQDFDLMKLIPQILPGHRLWADAANQDERFIALHEVRVMEDSKSKQSGLSFYCSKTTSPDSA